MGLNARWIKLGRIFMVAWLSFYLFPISVIATGTFKAQDKVLALALLLGSAAVWVWFWTRIAAGPDARFRLVAVTAESAFIAIFTLMTPSKYGTLFAYVVVLLGASFRWRLAVPLIVLAAFAGGALDLVRGAPTLQATGDLVNDTIVGLSAVAGCLLIAANQQLS